MKNNTFGQQQGNHQDFSHSIHSDGCFHIRRGEFSVVLADIGFIEDFAKILMRTTESTIENTCQSCLWVAAVGRGVIFSVSKNETEVMGDR